MDPKHQWQADRITHQQAIEYKNLLDIRVKHSEALHWDSLDLIQGKGTGLVILLHGVPGIGKTATAEAIAQANGKPLFKTTIGHLGMIHERLEISLREKFRLARIWDHILLLDEADTFFAQWSQADMATNKNALVSGELFDKNTLFKHC
jgi:SpoVK/Ycf46/Vps4 family AAA+-type ATPase